MKRSQNASPSLQKLTNSVRIETHKMIKSLYSDDPQFVILKEAAFKYHCIVLLPPASVLNDLTITPDLLATHIILLDPSHKFITLSYVPGVLQDSIIRMYPKIAYSTFYPRLLEEAEQSIRNNSYIHSVSVESVDSLFYGDNQLTVLHINNIIIYDGCEWKWKEFTMYDNTEYQIKLFFQQKIEFLNKGGDAIKSDIKQKTRNTLNEEIVIYKIINLDSLLLKEIENFILKYPLMVKGVRLEERECIINKYCEDTCNKMQKGETYCVMNQNRLKSVIRRMLITRLFPFIWQPSITVLEGLNFNSTMMDLSIKEIMRVHNFVSLKQLGLSNKNIPLFSEMIDYLKAVDGVRSPNDKLQYLNGVLLMVEQICKFFFTTHDITSVLKYVVIKSQIPYFASTLRYIETFGDNSNKSEVLNCYNEVLNFCSSLCQTSLCIDESTYDEEIQRVSNAKEIRIDCGPATLSDVQILGLLDFSTTEQPIQLDLLLKTNAENIRTEDIPILIQLIKQFNEENTELKKFISNAK